MSESAPQNSPVPRALHWLTAVMGYHDVPHQFFGGLAARAYGASRPLNNIDLLVPLNEAQAAVDELEEYLIRPRGPYRDASWDLVSLVLDYQGLPVYVVDSSAAPRYYHRGAQRWQELPVDFSAAQTARLYGVDVAVMPPEALIAYKIGLDRAVDQMDLEQMSPRRLG